MDVAFVEEIRLLNEKDGMFDSFPILPPIDYKFRCNEYNCGINVIKQMQSAYNGGKICVHVSFLSFTSRYCLNIVGNLDIELVILIYFREQRMKNEWLSLYS